MRILEILFPPKLCSLKPDELANSGEYHERMSRRGVENNPAMAAVIEFQAKERRVFYMGSSLW